MSVIITRHANRLMREAIITEELKDALSVKYL